MAKIIHHDDLDGRCAAAVVDKYFKERDVILRESDFIEMGYKDEFPLEKVLPQEEVVIVDFSLEPPVMEELLKITENIIWIDHHQTAMEYKYSVELRGIRSKEAAACKLAWNYFFPSTSPSVPRAVELVSDRDNWDWEHGEETELFNLGMQTIPHSPLNPIWHLLFKYSGGIDPTGDRMKSISERGRVALAFRDILCRDYADSYGFETTFEEVEAFVLPLYHFGSEAFGDKISKYRLCISFVFDGSQWTVGLYSEDIDVSVIAKKYGGGGHKGAAGFVCKELPFKKREERSENVRTES